MGPMVTRTDARWKVPTLTCLPGRAALANGVLFLADADHQATRQLDVVLARIEEPGHQVVGLNADCGSFAQCEVCAAAAGHGKFECPLGNSEKTLARVYGSQLQMREGRQAIEFAVGNNGTVCVCLERNIGSFQGAPNSSSDSVDLEPASEPVI